MSKRAYPQNPAVPTWANQPNAGVMGQPHRNMRGYPAPNVSHPPVSGYPGHQFGGQPIQNYPGQPGQNYSGQHYPGQPVKQYAGPSAHISQQRQAVLRPPSSNFPGPPPTIPQTTAGPWTAADVSTATTAVQQMQLDKQSGGVQLPAPTSTTGYLLPAQHPPQSSTNMGRYPSSLPTSTAPGVTHRLPSQAPTSSTYMGLSQPQNMRQPGTAGSTQAGPPPTHPSSTQAGPPPTHPSSTQAGPPPTHPSSTQAGPPPTHPSSTQAGPPPTHPSSTQAGPPPTHPGGTQSGPPPTHPGSVQAGPPPTHPSSTQSGPPPTHPSSTQSGPPPTHPSSTQAGPPPTHPGSVQSGPPPTHPGSVQSGPPPTHPGSVQAGPPPTHPGSVQAWPLPIGTGPPSAKQTLGRPPSGQLTGKMLPPPPTTGQMLPPPPTSGQMLPPPPTSGQMLPPPPTSGQMLPPPPTSGQMFPPPPTSGQMLPPPPTSGQMLPPPPTSGQMLPPPPTSGQMLPPPPTSGQMLPPPPTSGQMLPPPPTSGQMLPPPPTAGQMLPPPPTSGQMLPPPPTSGQMLPPPPTAGQMLPPPPTSGKMLPPPPTAGQMLPPPPTAGQMLPPPPTAGQMLPPPPTAGQMLPPPPTAGSGHRPPLGAAAGQLPGMRPPTGGAPVGGQGPAAAVTADPLLRPVNLLETRDLLPSSHLSPPETVLPGNLGQFNPSPAVFCSTMNAVPATSSLLNKLKLPFAVHIHPYREIPQNECPVIHPAIIVRCRVCRAYINPFASFIDSRHWRCNLCFRPNTLPEDFDFNPQSGKHGDRTHRMELRRASVEYVAPSEYMVRPPQPSVYYFVVDVSYNAIETGLLGVFCRTLLDNLERLPGDARTMIGILTFDSTLHFYNLKASLSQPQMLVVSDLEDVFLPSPEALLVNLRESKELVRTLLEDLPGIFANNRSVKCAMGAALQAAEKLLHHIGGRVTVLQTTLPNVGPGALKYRDVAPSSVKKDTLNMAPASDFYKKLALECSSQQIAVDLFAFTGQFIDLSTTSCISKFSSGQVFYYPDFHHTKEVPRTKFEKDFRRYLTRRIGFEAVMRMRCTEGLSLHTFHGNFFVRSTDLLSLPNVNPDHGYTINIAIDDSLKDLGMVCFQAALLYTSSRGERRIRVHTLALPVSNQLSQIYARLNIQAIAGVLANMAVDRSVSATLGDAREALMNVVIDSTKMYRGHFASSLQASQFTLPASLHLLPLFIISLLKHPAFTLNASVSYDGRTQAMNLIKSLPLEYLVANFYPHLYGLHTLSEKDVVEREDGKEVVSPPLLQLSAERVSRYGIFLMEYGLGLYIWVGKDAPHELVQKVFGVQHFGAIPEIMTSLPTQENETSTLVQRFIKQIRSSRQHFMPLQVIREDGPHRLLFIERLVEDRTEFGTSYYEFLTHINRQLSK